MASSLTQAPALNSLRKTKIVSTLGPAVSSYEILEGMAKAGVNVFRINFSFGKYDELQQYIDWIKRAAETLGRPIGILGDLQGPKFRTGEIENGSIELVAGKKINLAYAPKDELGNSERIVCPHEDLVSALKPGDRVLIYDGTMEIKVTGIKSQSPPEVETEVVRGGTLKPHKGLNFPTVQLTFTDLTEKDKKDAIWMLEKQLDFVGVSFVQTAEDVERVRTHWRAHIEKTGQTHLQLPLIVSKIEKPAALDNIDAIIAASDGIMVARGDLGVEVSLELVPNAQKTIIRKANDAMKPVITATQMLQSMTTEAVPTRAEVSDVANAVYDGSDATMTSAETSMSPHPVLVVETMAKILWTVENQVPQRKLNGALSDKLYEAIAVAALEIQRKCTANAILVFSTTGTMAKNVSHGVPKCPIICLTSSERTRQQMTLYYGVYPIYMPLGNHVSPTIARAEELILTSKLLNVDDLVVLCSGKLANLPGLSNSAKIYRFGEFLRKYTNPLLAAHHKKAAASEQQKP